MAIFEFPALQDTAGQMSAESQSQYLWLIRVEYSLLFVAAILSMGWSKEPTFFVLCAVVLLASLGTLLARQYLKPEQAWYRGRALAESIKTSSWRYAMRASPFDDADSVAIPRAAFRELLTAILKANRFIGDRMPPDSAANDQISQSMEKTRQLPLEDRKAYYLEHRIRDQREWYRAKSKANRMASRKWVAAGGLAYAVAITLSLLRIEYSSWEIWPIEPIIVLASAFIGWTQIKKFNELASSYVLTAHEIGMIREKIRDVDSEEAFSSFVNDAEQAFSREHTQWVARHQAD